MHHRASLTEYIKIQEQYQSISFLTSIARCLHTCEWSKYRHSHTGTRSHTNINEYTNTLHTHSLSHTPTHTYKRSRYIYTLYTEQVFDVVGLCLERVAGVLLQQFHLLPLNQGFLNLQTNGLQTTYYNYFLVATVQLPLYHKSLPSTVFLFSKSTSNDLFVFDLLICLHTLVCKTNNVKLGQLKCVHARDDVFLLQPQSRFSTDGCLLDDEASWQRPCRLLPCCSSIKLLLYIRNCPLCVY